MHDWWQTAGHIVLPLGTSGSAELVLIQQIDAEDTILISYTWSRCLDIGSGNYGLEGGSPPPDPYVASREYGPCQFNRKEALKLSGLYTLPFHGNRLVEGWQFNGILTAQTGPTFNPIIGFDQAGLLTNGQRPNLIPGNNPGNIILGLGNINRYANPAAFSFPRPGMVGNLGRDASYAPGLVDTDFSILKGTAVPKISEQFRVQFRAEFFNIFNHPNFGPPNATVFVQAPNGGATYNSTFGKITSTLTNPRQIQFGLKFIF